MLSRWDLGKWAQKNGADQIVSLVSPVVFTPMSMDCLDIYPTKWPIHMTQPFIPKLNHSVECEPSDTAAECFSRRSERLCLCIPQYEHCTFHMSLLVCLSVRPFNALT